MKIKWRLYIEIYDTLTRENIPPVDLATGLIVQQTELQELFSKVAAFLPADASYFKEPSTTMRTMSLTIESRLCYPSKNGNQLNSPALILEPDSEGLNILDLRGLMLEFAALI